MFAVAQRIDHMKLRGRRRKLFEQLLRKRPNDDRVDPPLDIARDVGNRFPFAERGIRLQRYHVAAELVHRNFERRTRAERRLLEQHRHVPAIERVRRRREAAERSVRFHLRREIETAFELDRIEVEHREEIFSGPRNG